MLQKCMAAGNLKIAASYLLVLHNLEPLEQSSRDTVCLLQAAMAKDEWQLCKELSRFLFSLDHTGAILQDCLDQADALPNSGLVTKRPPVPRRSASMPNGATVLPSSAQPALSPPAVMTGPAPFQRTGSTARNLHYRMSSSSGLGLGGFMPRVGTPPHEHFRRSLSGASTPDPVREEAKERDDGDDPE